MTSALDVLIPLFAAVSCWELSLIFLVLDRRVSRRAENLTFCALAFFLGLMNATIAMLEQPETLRAGVLAYRLHLFSLFGIAAVLIHFASLITRQPLPRFFAPAFLYPLAALGAAFAWHDAVLHLPPPGIPLGNLYLEALGPLFPLYGLFPVAGTVFACVLMILRLRRMEAVRGNGAEFAPLIRHLSRILACTALIILAGVFEFAQVVFFPGLDLWISPRSVAAVLFCAVTAWALCGEMVLAEDVKRRLAVENRQLDRLAQSRFQAARDVEHEVKNKLAAIQSPLRVALRGMERGMKPARQREFLRDALDEVGELNRLLGGLLNTARMAAGHDPYLEPRAPVDVAVLAQSVCRKKEQEMALERQADDAPPGRETPPHRLRCESRLDPPDALLHADPLRQVLTNLVDNAVKYSPGGGRVEVRVWEEGGEVRLSVSDEGIGMTAAQQARLFHEPYYRGRNDDPVIGGMGLGLHLVRRLMEAQGGRIWVESRPGAGSAFFLALPLLRN